MEKQYLQQFLSEHGVFAHPTPEDARYFFFSLPSIIIVKGYALGFMHETVKRLMQQFILNNKLLLAQRSKLKVQFRL